MSIGMLRLRSANAQADDEATPHVHGLGILESAPRAVAWSQAHERAFTPHHNTTQHNTTQHNTHMSLIP
jgi:hypothetical protein